jgi:hypothetical protein
MSPQASPQVAFMNTSSMQEQQQQQQQQHQPATAAAAATASELSTAQSTSLHEPTGKFSRKHLRSLSWNPKHKAYSST